MDANAEHPMWKIDFWVSFSLGTAFWVLLFLTYVSRL